MEDTDGPHVPAALSEHRVPSVNWTEHWATSMAVPDMLWEENCVQTPRIEPGHAAVQSIC